MSYDEKFRGLVAAIAQAKERADFLLVHNPQALGDDYEELIESLNRIAEAQIALRILPPVNRERKDYHLN